MKKNLAMLLAAVALLLSACGGTTPGGQSSSIPASGQTETSAPRAAPAPPAGGDGIQFDSSAAIEETVLVDESDVKITATELKYTAYDVKLSLTIENNSSQNLSFHSGTLRYNCNSTNPIIWGCILCVFIGKIFAILLMFHLLFSAVNFLSIKIVS